MRCLWQRGFTWYDSTNKSKEEHNMFSENLKTMRKEKGLTQAQLAEKLNITDRAVSKWETGGSLR